MALRIARFLPRSTANGPGNRTVFWTAGCGLHCRGCSNQWSWDPNGPATDYTPDQLVEMIPPDVEGISLSGGEPTQQDLATLADFVERVSWQGRGDKTVLIFTGYTMPELQERASRYADMIKLLAHVDILVSGRYVKRHNQSEVPLLGSSNQEVIFLSNRYDTTYLSNIVPAELHFDIAEGTVIRTGITNPF